MKEQLLKTGRVPMCYPLGKKKLRKPYEGWHPLSTPPVRPMVK